ncbi:MAG: DUF389 domain-containing protein [Chloroflexi bacterium]|nr:DUF389 domain-containing protein [Chloroflexota bacterium]
MEQPETFPPLENEPQQEFVSARARRRRALRRVYFPTDKAERAALYAHLAKRAFPSYELFIFALVAGAIMGVGYFLNAPGVLVFGALAAPVLTPWIGISLAVVAGAGRFFLQTVTALFVSSGLFLFTGFLAGFATRIFPQPLTFNEAFTHSRLWWYELIVLAIGAILVTLSFVRSERNPYLPSAMVAYELFLPLAAAGFGLGSGVGIGEIWPQGVLVFLVHFAWATLFCILTLFFLRFYPASFGGFSLTGIILIVLIGWLGISTGAFDWLTTRTGLAAPPPASTHQPTATLPLVAATSTRTPEPATAFLSISTSTPTATSTPKPTNTVPPTQTPTYTVTAEPTPIIALIRAAEGGGAFIREKPGGLVIATLSNGSSVVVVPNDLQEVNNTTWVHVIANVNDVRVEGWIIQSLLVTATPIPNWEPSATQPATSTP